MDVRKGPLCRAQEHIAEYDLTQYIETRLSDGLGELRPDEGDTLVLAGMGGPLMERILTEGACVLRGFRELILQPQSDIPHFRRFIRKKGYEIVQEELILEEGKFYPMMKAVWAETETMLPYTREEEAFGKLLLTKRHPVLKQYLERELRIRAEILNKLREAPGESAQKRLKEIEEEKQLIEAALDRYDSKRTECMA